jgi:hypothetical protein
MNMKRQFIAMVSSVANGYIVELGPRRHDIEDAQYCRDTYVFETIDQFAAFLKSGEGQKLPIGGERK